MARYYLVETQMRSDGDQNQSTTPQYSFGNALNAYFAVLEKRVVVTTDYTAFHVSLLDENMEIVRWGGEELHKDITVPVSE